MGRKRGLGLDDRQVIREVSGWASVDNAGIAASSGDFVVALIGLPEVPSEGRRFRAVFRGPEKRGSLD